MIVMEESIFNTKVKEAFNIVLNINNEKFITASKMDTGVCSEVYKLNNKYIVKFNSLDVLESEFLFLTNNYNELNEQILYFDRTNSFIVYKYIEHTNDIPNNLEANFINTMKNYVYSYKNTDMDGFGFVLDKKSSWVDFLKTEIDQRKHYALKMLDYQQLSKVHSALKNIEKYPIDKVLLHGDLGLHNILFNKNTIVGVIDPETMLGDRIYDFLSLLFSDINLCRTLSIDDIYIYLPNESQEKIKNMIVLILFDRIIRCVRHNIPLIKDYLKLWDYYSNII